MNDAMTIDIGPIVTLVNLTPSTSSSDITDRFALAVIHNGIVTARRDAILSDAAERRTWSSGARQATATVVPSVAKETAYVAKGSGSYRGRRITRPGNTPIAALTPVAVRSGSLGVARSSRLTSGRRWST